MPLSFEVNVHSSDRLDWNIDNFSFMDPFTDTSRYILCSRQAYHFRQKYEQVNGYFCPLVLQKLWWEKVGDYLQTYIDFTMYYKE